jgi:hypothetical protein
MKNQILAEGSIICCLLWIDGILHAQAPKKMLVFF